MARGIEPLGPDGPVKGPWSKNATHGPAPARARELGTCARANGLSPWPAWPAEAAMGRYGPLGPLGRARPSDPTYTQFPEGILRTPE